MNKWKIPIELKSAVERIHNPTQTDIDTAQNKQIARLEEVDKKHDGQFTISIILDMWFLIWLIALTGAVVLKGK